ncbi:hypothetical protein Tco_1365320 [Tanacetum coccineum]
MSSLTKLVASNIINRSLHCFTKNTNVHSNLFTRPVISRSIDSNNNSHLSVLFTRSVIMSRFFNTNASRDLQAEFDACLVYPNYMLNKDHTRQSEREKLSVSSNALRIWPTRVKDNAERLCLYLQMPEVLEDDLKVSVEHNTECILNGNLILKSIISRS